MSLTEWITKPKLMMTALDNFIMYAELITGIFTVAVVLAWISVNKKQRRRKETMKRHGEHCTCFTCMGVD